MSSFVLPYEPDGAAYLQANQKRRRDTKRWMREREPKDTRPTQSCRNQAKQIQEPRTSHASPPGRATAICDRSHQG